MLHGRNTLYHAQRPLQASYFHYPSDQMQTSRHQHLMLPLHAPDQIHCVLDRRYDVSLLWVVPGHQLEPGVPELILGR